MAKKKRSGVIPLRHKPRVRRRAKALLPPPAFRPHWDPWRRTLFLNGQVVKRIVRAAPNIELVFEAFEKQKWVQRIDNPLPAVRGRDRKRTLHETVMNINRRLDCRLLIFRDDAKRTGIRWQLV